MFYSLHSNYCFCFYLFVLVRVTELSAHSQMQNPPENTTTDLCFLQRAAALVKSEISNHNVWFQLVKDANKLYRRKPRYFFHFTACALLLLPVLTFKLHLAWKRMSLIYEIPFSQISLGFSGMQQNLSVTQPIFKWSIQVLLLWCITKNAQARPSASTHSHTQNLF